MESNYNELFWNASVEEIENGFVEYEREFVCIVCGEHFEKGRIYDIDSILYDAKKAVMLHIEKKHGNMLEYLLGLNSAYTGISDVQREIITLMFKGFSDKEIALKLGVAQSTIRNHRYKLRGKEKQAKLFLAIMKMLADSINKKITKLEKEEISDFHITATSIDDRYNITDKEKIETVKKYMDENGALKSYPAREKKKIIILSEISKNFSKGKIYSEKEINRILKRVYDDYATIRRALVEYGFIDRTNDGSKYWVKE